MDQRPGGQTNFHIELGSSRVAGGMQHLCLSEFIGDQFHLLLYDALASKAMSTLATGVFLTGFAVAHGSSNFAIGILAAVPSAIQFLQFPTVMLVEHHGVGVRSAHGLQKSAGHF